MSYAIHVATKYQVEYDTNPKCGNRAEELNDMLYALCPDGAFGDCVSDSDYIELTRAEAANAIERLKDPDDDIAAELAANGFTADEMAGMLNYWLEKSDPRNDYIVLQWF